MNLFNVIQRLKRAAGPEKDRKCSLLMAFTKACLVLYNESY